MVDILKGKSTEDIKTRLDSDEEFKNKDFLLMIQKVHPEEFEKVCNLLPELNLGPSIFEAIQQLINTKDMVFSCSSVIKLSVFVYLLKLCGIHESNIIFINENIEVNKDIKENNNVIKVGIKTIK